MRKLNLFTTLLSFGLLWSYCSLAQVLIIQSSDNHSKYQHIEDFVRSTEIIMQDFKMKHPTGQIVFVFNGDYSGASKYTGQDLGDRGYQLLHRLAQDYPVLFTFGNHEAFDWINQGIADDLFHRQMKQLHANGVTLLVRNAIAKPQTQKLFTKHFDLTMPQGTTLRFSGLTLEELLEKVNSRDKQVKEIYSVRSYQQELRDIIAESETSKGRIKHIVAFHDSQKHTLLAMNEAPEKIREHIPLVFSAHDHQVHVDQVGKTTVIDSGSNFEFSTIELDTNGEIRSHEFFPHLRQQELILEANNGFIPVPSRRYLTAIKGFIARPEFNQEKMRQVKLPRINESKLTLKQGRSLILGNALADSLQESAKEVQRLKKLNEVAGVIAFFNSSSYRLDSIIPAGILDAGDIRDISPMANKVTVYRLSGKEVQRFYRSYRKFRQLERVYSPQMSSNLREGERYQLRIFNAKGSEQINENAKYLVALDHFSATNGYNIPEHEKILTTDKIIAESDQFEILKKYFPSKLSQKTRLHKQNCFTALALFYQL